MGAMRPVQLLHLTDPHLFADETRELYEVNTADSLRAVLREALTGGRARPDAILVTGDVNTEVYLEQAFADLLRPDCPNARLLGESSLMVEVHPTLRQDLLERRAERLRAIIEDVVV